MEAVVCGILLEMVATFEAGEFFSYSCQGASGFFGVELGAK
jgi:hypothetical protein